MEQGDSVNENHPSPNSSNESQDDSKEPKQEVLTPSIADSEPAVSQERCANDPGQKWWDKSKPVVEIVGILLLAIYTAFTGCMYFANKKAADAAKIAADVATDSIRPWLKITSIDVAPSDKVHTLAFHWTPTGAAMPPFLQYKISFENVGHSVAQNVAVEPDFFWAKFGSGTWYNLVTAEEATACHRAEAAPESPGIIVFPSDRTDWDGGVGTVGIPSYGSGAALIVCVNYRGAPGTLYQTQAWATLLENGERIIPIGVDEDSGMRLEREPNGDHAN